MSAAHPVAVYGASGYTGRLVSAALAERGITPVLVGRDPARLQAAADALGIAATDVRVAPVDDPVALADAFEGARVVANCAGPFVRTGEPVLRAAMQARCHYLDTTGEQPWIARVFEDFGADLERAGVAAVAGMGFDYVPGDLLCHLVGERCEPLADLLVAYHLVGFGMTRGTMRSSLEMLGGGDITYRDGDWAPAGHGPRRAFVEFPAPVGRRQVGKYPCGEIVTVPRHLQVRNVRSAITLDSLLPHALAWTLPPMLPGIALAMRTPLAGVLDRGVGLLPEGPAEEDRRAVSWTIIARATGADGGSASGIVRGSDVYGLTAQTIAAGAERMAADAFKAAGAHAPASAFDPAELMQALAPHGVAWELS